MVLEELRSWDAYELNARNHIRMIEKVRMRVLWARLHTWISLGYWPPTLFRKTYDIDTSKLKGLGARSTDLQQGSCAHSVCSDTGM